MSDEYLIFYTICKDAALKYSDGILVVKNDNGPQVIGRGGCVYIESNGLIYGITAEHVISSGEKNHGTHIIHCPIRRGINCPIKIDQGNTDTLTRAIPISEFIWRNKDLDIAIFKTDSTSLKNSSKYALALSDMVIFDGAMPPFDGLLSLICGMPPEKTDLVPPQSIGAPEGSLAMVSDLYLAMGPIVAHHDGCFIANFAEKELMQSGTWSDIKLTGGSRPLNGFSGSGLWILSQNKPLLCGIILGKSPENDDTKEHLIRCRQLNEIIHFLKSNSTKEFFL